jgi:hypothetical protein
MFRRYCNYPHYIVTHTTYTHYIHSLHTYTHSLLTLTTYTHILTMILRKILRCQLNIHTLDACSITNTADAYSIKNYARHGYSSICMSTLWFLHISEFGQPPSEALRMLKHAITGGQNILIDLLLSKYTDLYELIHCTTACKYDCTHAFRIIGGEKERKRMISIAIQYESMQILKILNPEPEVGLSKAVKYNNSVMVKYFIDRDAVITDSVLRKLAYCDNVMIKTVAPHCDVQKLAEIMVKSRRSMAVHYILKYCDHAKLIRHVILDRDISGIQTLSEIVNYDIDEMLTLDTSDQIRQFLIDKKVAFTKN